MSAGPSATGGDVARIEALRRLSVRSAEDGDAFDDLVALISASLDADAVSIVIVEQDRAWSLASTSTPALEEVPRAWSLADVVVMATEDLLVVEGAAGLPGEQPRLPELSVPSTMAAHVVRAPGGERVGAVEVAWEGPREIDDAALAYLGNACRIVTSMLELRAEVSEYGRFIDLTPNPVAVLDLDGAVAQANPAFADLVGAEVPGELLGRNFLELVARGDRARLTAELARVLFMQRRSGQLTCNLVAPDGGEIPCSITAGHLRGPRRHLQLIVHDLSERLRAEEEHSQLSEQLARAQRLDAVGQIAGGLAHDLNNLLVVMVSNLGLAQESLEDLEGSEIVQEDLGELETAIERASDMTSKLLAFARQEEGATEVADLSEVLESVQALMGRSLRVEVDLEVICPDQPPSLAVDPVGLERVLMNLVINARDALGEGGGQICIEVELTGDGGAVRPVAAAGPGARDGVRIQVRDDGCGMDDATQARAFEPLFTTKQASGGSGLGLATVLAFVEQVDGELRLESTPGEGTTIELWLPAAADDLLSLPVGVDVPVAGARVMLVDPGDRTRRVIAAMLTSAGYRVNALSTAEAAIAQLEQEQPQLLITELALPGMPGPRLIGEAMHRRPDLRCVAIAPVDGSPVDSEIPVLVKPFSHNRLLRTVGEALQAS